MATKEEGIQRDTWWLSELESLGVSPKVKSSFGSSITIHFSICSHAVRPSVYTLRDSFGNVTQYPYIIPDIGNSMKKAFHAMYMVKKGGYIGKNTDLSKQQH